MENTTIRGYVLKYKLGEGGMADVWYAENSLQMPAAIKILQKRFCNDIDVVSRFENEAKLMVQLNHPHIRKIQDFSTIDGQPCMVMEYLEGNDLSQSLKNGEKFTNEQIIAWWNDLVDVLKYTHGKNIIHRDIKPSNLFVTRSGQIKVLDFGIAKIKDNITVTQTGSRMGTLLYMSPEQVYDIKNLTYKTDIYSLAVTFYHLITGTAPYDSTKISDFEIQENIVRKNLDTSLLPLPWRNLLPEYLFKNAEDRKELRNIGVNVNELAVINTDVSQTIKTPERPAITMRSKKPPYLMMSFAIIAGLILLVLNKDRVMNFLKKNNRPKEITKAVQKAPIQQTPLDTEIQLPVVIPPDTTVTKGDDGATDVVTTTIDDKEKELQAKNLLSDYYKNRKDCGSLYRFFRDTVKQYYNKANVTLDAVMKECQKYHDKWRFTEAQFDDNSFVFTHQSNGNIYVDFSMVYRIKQLEEDDWTSYNIDVSAIIDDNMKITRIVERRIEKL